MGSVSLASLRSFPVRLFVRSSLRACMFLPSFLSYLFQSFARASYFHGVTKRSGEAVQVGIRRDAAGAREGGLSGNQYVSLTYTGLSSLSLSLSPVLLGLNDFTLTQPRLYPYLRCISPPGGSPVNLLSVRASCVIVVSCVLNGRYASLGAHEEKDQSRKDDLESLLYVFLDLYTGKLPWAEHVSCLVWLMVTAVPLLAAVVVVVVVVGCWCWRWSW